MTIQFHIAGAAALAAVSTHASLRASAFFDALHNWILFDCRHGVDTGHLGGRSVPGGYQSTGVQTLRGILGALPIRHTDYEFIDIGAGKGRALLVAAEFPFRRCLGIELQPELAEIASVNIGSYSNPACRCTSLEMRNQDAATFAFPDAPSVAFLFNPFPRKVLERVTERLAQSYQCAPRPILLVSHHPRWFSPIGRLPFFVEISLPGAPLDFFPSLRERSGVQCGAGLGHAQARSARSSGTCPFISPATGESARWLGPSCRLRARGRR